MKKKGIKNTRPVNAGTRDNSGERSLNANYSKIISPQEVHDKQTDSPTIHEEEDARKEG